MTERTETQPPSIPGIEIPPEFAAPTKQVIVRPRADISLDDIKDALSEAGISDPDKVIAQVAAEIRNRVQAQNKQGGTPVEVDKAVKDPVTVLTYVIRNAPALGLDVASFDKFTAAVEGGAVSVAPPSLVEGSDTPYTDQLNNFVQDLFDVFNEDTDFKRVIIDVMNDMEPATAQEDASGDSGGGFRIPRPSVKDAFLHTPLNPFNAFFNAADAYERIKGFFTGGSGIPDNEFEKYLRENNITVESFANQLATRLKKDGNAEDVSLLTYLVKGYRDGWLDGDNRDKGFDPEHRLPQVLQANNSPKYYEFSEQGTNKVDTLDEPLVIEDPYAQLDFSRFSAEQQNAVNQLIGSDWFRNKTAEDRAAILQSVLQMAVDQTANYIWQQSSLAGQLNDPADPNYNPRLAIDKATLSYYDAQRIGIDLRQKLQEGMDTLLSTPTYEKSNEFFSRLSEESNNAYTGILRTALSAIRGQQIAENVVNQVQNIVNAAAQQRNQPVQVNASTAQEALFTMPDKEFRDYQYKLYLAGAYGSADPSTIPWGERDDVVAFEQWNAAILESARANQRGTVLTTRQVLERAINLANQGREAAFEQARKDAATVVTPEINLDDPVALARNADIIAQQVLGRKATPEEKRLLVSLIHGEEIRKGTAKARREAARKIAETEQAISDVEQNLLSQQEEARIRSQSITDEQVTAITEQGGGEFVGPALGQRNEALAQANPQQQQQQTEAPSVTVGEPNITTAFDPNAAIEKYFRDNNSKEVAAQDLRRTLTDFFSIIRGANAGT